jgi:signal transduction histidine kinase
MKNHLDHRFLLRLMGFGVVGAAWAVYIIGKIASAETLSLQRVLILHLSVAAFCGAFWLTSANPSARSPRNALLLALQSGLVLLAVGFKAGYSMYLLCIIVVWQAALAYGWRVALWACCVNSTLLVLAFSASLPWAEAFRLGAFAVGFQLFAVVVAHIARSEAESARRLAQSNEELRAMQARLSDSVMQAERGRIARDLHDAVGHGLAALSLQLEVASHLAEEPALQHIQQSKSLTASLLDDIRSVIGMVREEHIVDLGAALAKLAQRVGDTEITITLAPEVRQDDPALNMVIFRIVQESITNTLRHAHADRMQVLVSCENGLVIVEATDNGRGQADMRPGHGLSGMRERAANWGGSVFLWTQPNAGFRVRAILPYALA